VVLHRGSWPSVDRGVEPGRHVAQRYAEEPCELAGASEHVHGPVEPEIELFELIVIAALGGRLEIGVHPLEPSYSLGVAVLDRAGGEFPGEQGLPDEHVTDIVAGHWDDDEAAARLEPYQALGAQLQQAFAHRSGTDTQALCNRFGTDEVAAVQFAGDDQVAYVRRGLGAELRAMAAVLPRPVRKLLGRLGQRFRVPGDDLSTALQNLAGHRRHGKGPLRTGMGCRRSSSSG
jgi:hypothetical protein